VVGLVGFFGPFLGCTAVARYILHWMAVPVGSRVLPFSTTSVAVVYAVMLELGFNVTDFGKAVLAACFINDLGTVIALGMIFSPFHNQNADLCGSQRGCLRCPSFSDATILQEYGGRVPNWKRNTYSSCCRDGRIGVWSGSEAVLPAYIIGMVLAEP